MYREIKPRSYRLLAILCWLAVWQFLALLVGQEFLLASPLRVLLSFMRLLLEPETYLAILSSGFRILLGFVLSGLFALLLSFASSKSRLARELILPLVSISRSVPVASFVILAIILVSSQWLSTLISFVIGFPIIYANVTEGLLKRDIKLQEMSSVFSLPFITRLRYITLPQLMPYLRSGLVTALGLCWKSGIAAEVIGIPRGSIGSYLYSVKVNYNTADLFAWTVIIVLLSIISHRLLVWLLNKGFERLAHQ